MSESPYVSIRAEGLSKEYRLGTIGRETLKEDVRRLWAGARRRSDPPAAGPFPPEGRPDRILALDDVSFELHRGESFAVVGDNGSGKSTLLKILSRVTTPTRGTARIRGTLSSLLEVGTGFHPDLTGRENVFLNGAILGMKQADIARQFDEIVAFAEISRFVDTPVKRYSSGMYVRLAFAVAAHLQSEILLVDEVLAVGDIGFQRKCLGKMGDVAAEGRTVVFVSHNLSAVRSFCRRGIRLHKGKVVDEGEVGPLLDRYAGRQAGEVCRRRWDVPAERPRNGTAEILEISLADESGLPVECPRTDEPFRVAIDYSVTGEGGQVMFSLDLFDGESRNLFSSLGNLEPEWYGRKMPPGDYRTTCRIPANLLNDGWFTIKVNLFGAGLSDPVSVPNALAFEVQDGSALRGDFCGRWGGSLRPALEWRTAPARD
jgi:lipopolysaccharide transport system ATP-binding protein